MNKMIRCLLLAFAMPCVGAVFAADPVPKKGGFSGIYGWHYSVGQNIAVNDDHMIFGGVVSGPFVGEGGLLHAAAVTCTFAGEFRKDQITHDGGDCLAIDQQGDKITFHWECTNCAEGIGSLEITNGTGKYTGIRGSGTFRQNTAGTFESNAGWSVWKGRYELP